jgi:sugar phosphate isomerase/epimerase
MELDMVRDWLHLIAIKDMNWEKAKDDWQAHVVPAGKGIVRWTELSKALTDCGFGGTISLHGEYETKDLDERKRLAKEELDFLKKKFGN